MRGLSFNKFNTTMARLLLSPGFFFILKWDILIASVRLSVRLSVMLSPPKPLDEIQPDWCVNYSHESGVQIFLALPLWPWGGVKRSNIIISFSRLGHVPAVGLLGFGVPRGSKKYVLKHGHVSYQIDGDDEQNKI